MAEDSNVLSGRENQLHIPNLEDPLARTAEKRQL
jgi:hypothetical protein